MLHTVQMNSTERRKATCQLAGIVDGGGRVVKLCVCCKDLETGRFEDSVIRLGLGEGSQCSSRASRLMVHGWLYLALYTFSRNGLMH